MHIGKREVPLGVLIVSAVLLTTAIVNLLTKREATIGGVAFSLLFFIIFTYSERRVTRERQGKLESVDQFRVYGNQELGSGAMGVRAGNVLVAVRDPRELYYLLGLLWHSQTNKQKKGVMVARL